MVFLYAYQETAQRVPNYCKKQWKNPLGNVFLNVEEMVLGRSSEVKNMWNNINNEQDLTILMDAVCAFHDSCIKEMKYISGAYFERRLRVLV